MRNGVGLKGRVPVKRVTDDTIMVCTHVEGVLRTKLDEIDQMSLNVFLRYVYHSHIDTYPCLIHFEKVVI